MRNDDRSTESLLTSAGTARPSRTPRLPLFSRLAIQVVTELPQAERAYDEGAIEGAHLRILAVHVRRLPMPLRPIFDDLGTALARELPWTAFLPVAANLRRHLHGSRG